MLTFFPFFSGWIWNELDWNFVFLSRSMKPRLTKAKRIATAKRTEKRAELFAKYDQDIVTLGHWGVWNGLEWIGLWWLWLPSAKSHLSLRSSSPNAACFGQKGTARGYLAAHLRMPPQRLPRGILPGPWALILQSLGIPSKALVGSCFFWLATGFRWNITTQMMGVPISHP